MDEQVKKLREKYNKKLEPKQLLIDGFEPIFEDDEEIVYRRERRRSLWWLIIFWPVIFLKKTEIKRVKK